VTTISAASPVISLADYRTRTVEPSGEHLFAYGELQLAHWEHFYGLHRVGAAEVTGILANYRHDVAALFRVTSQIRAFGALRARQLNRQISGLILAVPARKWERLDYDEKPEYRRVPVRKFRGAQVWAYEFGDPAEFARLDLAK
jgi:hypothetical protein